MLNTLYFENGFANMIFKLFDTTWNKEEKEELTIDWICNFCEGVQSFTSSGTVYITFSNNYNFQSGILQL